MSVYTINISLIGCQPMPMRSLNKEEQDQITKIVEEYIRTDNGAKLLKCLLVGQQAYEEDTRMPPLPGLFSLSRETETLNDLLNKTNQTLPIKYTAGAYLFICNNLREQTADFLKSYLLNAMTNQGIDDSIWDKKKTFLGLGMGSSVPEGVKKLRVYKSKLANEENPRTVITMAIDLSLFIYDNATTNNAKYEPPVLQLYSNLNRAINGFKEPQPAKNYNHENIFVMLHRVL